MGAIINRTRSLLVAVLVAVPLCGLADSSGVATQGQFASELAQSLGYEDLNAQAAIEQLGALSIRPGVGPNSKWEIDAPATDLFVAKVQASLQMKLQNVSEKLNIPVPPSLGLHIIELPNSAQHVPSKERMPEPRKDPAATGDAPPAVPPPSVELPTED